MPRLRLPKVNSQAIVRRQRPHNTALKISNVPTRYPNLPRDFEFAGYAIDITPAINSFRWGSMSYLDLTQEDLNAAQAELDVPNPRLGQWVHSH